MSDCQLCHGNHYVLVRDQRLPCSCLQGDPDPTPDFDSIYRPRHYVSGGHEPYSFIESWEMSFAEGNVVKYVVRWKDKGGVVDLEKARWYLDRLIEEAKREAV